MKEFKNFEDINTFVDISLFEDYGNENVEEIFICKKTPTG